MCRSNLSATIALIAVSILGCNSPDGSAKPSEKVA